MPSWTTLRRAFSRDRIRRFKQMTSGVQSAPPAGTYTGVADTSDAQRIFVSSDLGSSSVTDGEEIRPDYYDNWYLYLLTAGPEQRRVALGGYAPNNTAASVTDHASTSIVVGYVTLERALGAVVPAGTVGELHAVPVLDDGAPGVLSFVNQALGSMRLTRTITLTPDGTRRIEVTGHPWLTKQSMLGRVLGPSASYANAMDASAIGACKLQFDAEKTYLILPYAPGASDGSLFVECFMPRKNWILVKRQATATATVAAGAVTALTLTDGGVGYVGTATVSIGGAGTGASATVTVAGGAVTGFSGLVGGSGYVQASTTVTLSAPDTTTWTASTAGLVNEADECTGDEREITLVAYYHYLSAQLGADPRGASPHLLREWQAVASAAAPMLVYDQDALVPVDDPSGAYGMPDSPAWRAFRGQSFVGRGWGGGGWP